MLLGWWLVDHDDATVVDYAPHADTKTLYYQGVRVEVPSSWAPLDLGDCEFWFEAWGPPTQRPCRAEAGVSFYASATYDPATGPGLHRVDVPGKASARSRQTRWDGYESAGNWAVYVQDDSKDVVREALASVR